MTDDAGWKVLRADWVVAHRGNVVQDGELLIHGGRVADVGAGLVRSHPAADVCELPGCVLMPGFVNAHTHLEQTLLRGIGRGLAYADWITLVKEEILSRPQSFFQEGAIQGVAEMLRGGVTCVADHSTFGCSPSALAAAGMRGVVFREVFCVDPRQDCLPPLGGLAHILKEMGRDGGAAIEIGLSCHAPHNAAKPHLERVAREFGSVRRSIHVAESPEEMAYLRSGEGPLAEGHRARGIPVDPLRMSPVEYLDNCGYWVAGTQAVHLTQASLGDLAVLRARSASAAFCPVSNAALGVGIPPVAAARRAGIQCALGTDGAMCSERLDMFEEMRFAVLSSRLRRDPVAPEDAFSMATDEGARALGLSDVGRLEAGRRADVVALRLPSRTVSRRLIEDIVMQGSADAVESVWCAGRRVDWSQGQASC